MSHFTGKGFTPDVPDPQTITLPVTPVIPPDVASGEVIRAAHENQVSKALSDLWVDVQALGSGAVPSTRKVIAGTGLTGGGDLTADRTFTVNSAAIAGGIQTPWLQNIDGNFKSLSNVAGLQMGGNFTCAGTASIVGPLTLNATLFATSSNNKIAVTCDTVAATGSAVVAATIVSALIKVGLIAAGGPFIQFWTDSTPTKAGHVGLCIPGAAGVPIGDMVFATYNTPTWSERMRITNAGSIGIGTTTPAAGFTLDVNGLIRFGPSPPSSAAYITTYNDTAATAQFGICGSTHPSYPNAGYLNSSSGKLTLIASVGVGVNLSPAFPLHVMQGNPNSAATATQIVIQDGGYNPGYRFQLGFYVQGGTTWTGAIQALAGGSGVPLVLNALGGFVGIGTTTPAYALDVGGAGATGKTSRLGNIAIVSADAGYEWWTGSYTVVGPWQVTYRNISTSAYSNPVTVLPSGNVGIGTVSPSVLLEVAGAVRAVSLTATNTIVVTGAAGTYRVVFFQTGAGGNRFSVGIDDTAETGSNAGSLFRVLCYSDAGAVSFPLTINRATQVTNLAGLTTINAIVSGVLAVGGASNTGQQIQLSDQTTGRVWTVYSVGDTVSFRNYAATDVLTLNASGGLLMAYNLGCSHLPSTAPGAGSKQFWYDPADGNRVKYVP